MSNLIMVTGGTRSGKSLFAEQLCSQKGEKIIYLATGEPFDEEMKDRIKKHQNQRPSQWMTIEAYHSIQGVFAQVQIADTILMDCVTVYINNMIFHSELEVETATREQIDLLQQSILQDMESFIKQALQRDLHLIIVTDEIGMGIVPENKLSRIYRDIVGIINQRIAVLSDEVYLVVSGIPLKIK